MTRGRRGVAAWLAGLRLRGADAAWCALIPPATLAVTAPAYRLADTPPDRLVAAPGRGRPLLLTHYASQAAALVAVALRWRRWWARPGGARAPAPATA